jgi:D-amino-acid dehydrogenase
LLHWLAVAVLEARGKILWDTDVLGLAASRSEQRRVAHARTAAGAIEADAFVIAGGAWSPALARCLGVRLPVQPGKGYSVTLPAPSKLPAIPAILVEARVAVTPMGTGVRFAGTMELGALDRKVNHRRLRAMLRSVAEYLPDYPAAVLDSLPVWSGLRPCSPDGLPYVGRLGRFDNVLVATGHAMMGISLAPVTGKLIAEMLCGDPPSIDVVALAPDRFG